MIVCNIFQTLVICVIREKPQLTNILNNQVVISYIIFTGILLLWPESISVFKLMLLGL